MKPRRIRMPSKGQIVVPPERHEGTSLEMTDTLRGLVVRGAALVGCIPYRGPKHSLAEMDRAILAEARRRGAR